MTEIERGSGNVLVDLGIENAEELTTKIQLAVAINRIIQGRHLKQIQIAELQRLIDTGPAETLEDAAVKLRRLGAYIEQGQQARLLAGALGAVERAAN